MAVSGKYVVIREGEEKMSFSSKKEAEAYVKNLCTADLFFPPSAKSTLVNEKATT